MENVLTVKFMLFLAMELFVIGVLGAVLVMGLYQIVQGKIRESRRLNGVASDILPATRQAS